ncbi:protein-glutamate methylesterase/protein-glutamine glutaminase [Parathalassolituus penaei]|uniref:Protein-glutamate methylesterase/protein-glutamine glutaminase n=1 Tax=Parathalassolituus penaei TaxID=2997323 RepID=A0A9X3ECM9_9GAMM|nr:chemotaxis response regulator protein-glutamate methylesterase [Parathalassolituus penaei]MCY0965127.1 chemotaxis response regulator protein-glutamate methylesterase [Parathalassolituus penaei]
MTIRVLVVDDSGFFRRRVSDMINADPRMKVIGDASNGREAIELNDQLKPDVITMDYEMPVMDGITALRNIMLRRPVPVLMFSSLSFEGARVTLDALDAGALDYLPKNFDAVAKGTAEMRRTLTEKIVAVSQSRQGRGEPEPEPAPVPRPAAPIAPAPIARPAAAPVAPAPIAPAPAPRRSRLSGIELIMIGTSTGGPAALQTLFRSLAPDFRIPIVIIQHMPASFTKAFAERLNSISSMNVREAVEGDRIVAGNVYVAPGGMQLMLENRGSPVIRIRESDERVNYRPSVDIAFASAAKHFGSKTLGIVLTGMGADGREGARLLKSAGGHIWAQDEASCVIYGMPMAVIKAGFADDVLSLKDFGPRLSTDVN